MAMVLAPEVSVVLLERQAQSKTTSNARASEKGALGQTACAARLIEGGRT